MNNIFCTKNLDVYKLQAALNELIEFLSPYKNIVTSHTVDFYTKDHWANIVPIEFQNEVSKQNLASVYSLFLNTVKNRDDYVDNTQENLSLFFKNCTYHSLRRNVTNTSAIRDIQESLNCTNFEIQNSLKLRDYMSEKKNHEVQVMSEVVAMLAHSNQLSHVVDIGGGKGYLSSILALLYNIKVLGLDASQITTCGAVKRVENITKHWCGAVINESSETTNKDKIKKVQNLINSSYKQLTYFVSSETQVSKLLEENFQETVPRFGLIGLHTCGDLAATSLKMFVQDPKISSLVNVGCCYHLIEEEFCRNEFWRDMDVTMDKCDYGFPMSAFLRGKKYQLGRNPRMLAAHNIDRFGKSSEFSLQSILFRSLLQVLLEKYRGHTYKDGQVGRLASKCSSFSEYVVKAMKKLDTDFNVDDDEIAELYQTYSDRIYQLDVFYLLRVGLSQTVEAIILLDRLLYLLEKGLSNSYLVPLFDPVTSPRCFGIISWKS